MISISRYTPDRQQEWDDFVLKARNATFLFMRAYMDYHSDRFTDHSMMWRNENGKLIAVMPANIDGDTLWSHQGLTYGGMLFDEKMLVSEVGQAFKLLLRMMHDNGIRSLYYKPVPSIYHRLPSEDDEYWLWRYRATLTGCNISAATRLDADHIPMHSRKRSYCNRCIREGFTINRDTPLDLFWPVLTENLHTTYGASPVHTLEEMQRLKANFPDEIKCWTVAGPEGNILGGAILYVTPCVVHTQYISASEEGKQSHALDYLFTEAVRHFSDEGIHRFFDFGTSNEQGGMVLNDSLIMQKEGFGGRGIAYKTYVISNS